MELSLVVGFVLISLTYLVTPGPPMFLLSTIVPSSGRSVGITTVTGLCTGTGMHGILTVLGLTFLITQNAWLFFTIKLLGATFIIWLGVGSLIAVTNQRVGKSFGSVDCSRKSHFRGFFDGFMTNILNPYTPVFYLVVFPQLIPKGQTTEMTTLLFVALYICINFFWFGIVVVLLAKIVRTLKKPRSMEVVNIASGVSLLLMGCVFFFLAFQQDPTVV